MIVRARLGWVKLCEQVGDAGVVRRRCGVSRPTLRKCWCRYQAEGEPDTAEFATANLGVRRAPPQHGWAKLTMAMP